MQEQQNLELESSLNPEHSLESEPLKFLPFGIIITLISGLGGIVVMAIPSQPSNNQSPSPTSKLELFSPLISQPKNTQTLDSVPQPSPGSPTPFIMGNLMTASGLKTHNYVNILEEISRDNPAAIQPNFLEENIDLIPRPEQLNIDDYSSNVGRGDPTPTGIIENSMTALNLTANRPQYQMLTQQPSDVQPSPSVPNVSQPDGVELTLRDVIILGLENNRTIKNEYVSDK